MPGLVPGIHVFQFLSKKDVDGRDKPGHDGYFSAAADSCRSVMRGLVLSIARTPVLTHISRTADRPGSRKPELPVGSFMLDTLRQFIADLVSPTADRSRAFDETDYRLAATALLVHVISLDGAPTAIEKQKLHSLLESRFKLDPGTADQLIASATLVEGEAVDLYHFTSVIMRSVDEEGRLRIVEMMWELVYADGQVTEFEDNVVWRAADLLGVSSRDRIELKHRVAAAGAAEAERSAAAI
jgi:uncharacterized tellurite resistance protein B-like protein